MTIEKSIEEIKKMFWGVLKGKFDPEEEEDVKARLITHLAALTSYVKTCLPPEQQTEYEKHFSSAKDILLKFDSAGPWFREIPEMIDTVYNVITYANMLQIEYHRFSGIEDDVIQYINSKLETLEMNVNSIFEDLKKIKTQTSTLKEFQQPSPTGETEIEEPVAEEIEEPVVEEIEVVETTIEESLTEEPVIEEKVVSEVEVFDEKIELEEDLEIRPEETVAEEVEIDKAEIKITEVSDKEESADDTSDLIEGIELASKYEFEQEPFMQTIETEQEALKHLANLLSALDPGDDTVISPLTEKLMTIGDEDEGTLISELPSIESEVISEEGLSDEELAEVHEYRSSVARLTHVLSTPAEMQEASEFVSSIKETIASVSKEKDIEPEEKSALTKLIEAEAGEEEKPPVQSDDIANVIKHLETRRQKALERIQNLEEALNSEKINEEEWQELRIKAERHMLRIEDTLDGYKRYLAKLQSQTEE